MSEDRRAALSNEPEAPMTAWAAWPGLGPHMAAWTAISSASMLSWMTLQQVWLDALRRQQDTLLTLPGDADGPAAALLTATVEDMRECGEVVMRAQIDALQAWRRSA